MSNTALLSFSWWERLTKSEKKRLINDALFVGQVAGMLVLCGSQFFNFLHDTKGFKGVSLSMLFLAEAYILLHFQLAWSAHKAQPSRETIQVVWSFVGWFFGLIGNILAIYLNGTYTWSANDTTTLYVALIAGTVVMGVSHLYGEGRKDPRSRAGLAILFKSFPQFMMAVKAVSQHGSTLPGWAIAAGNVTIGIRIYQVWVTIQEKPDEKNRRWLFISEVVNEISWASVTIIWLIWNVFLS